MLARHDLAATRRQLTLCNWAARPVASVGFRSLLLGGSSRSATGGVRGAPKSAIDLAATRRQLTLCNFWQERNAAPKRHPRCY